MSPFALLARNLDSSIAAKQALLEDEACAHSFRQAADALVDCYKADGRVYIAGNGGSAADAQHLAAEFVSKLARDRAPLPAEALTVDSSILTAIGNDYGFEEVFARQLEGKAQKRDVFLAISTSGNSPNILRALECSNALGLVSIALTGRNGGAARGLATHTMAVPGEATSTIQELHAVVYHTLCECVERAVFPAADDIPFNFVMRANS